MRIDPGTRHSLAVEAEAHPPPGVDEDQPAVSAEALELCDDVGRDLAGILHAQLIDRLPRQRRLDDRLAQARLPSADPSTI